MTSQRAGSQHLHSCHLSLAVLSLLECRNFGIAEVVAPPGDVTNRLLCRKCSPRYLGHANHSHIRVHSCICSFRGTVISFLLPRNVRNLRQPTVSRECRPWPHHSHADFLTIAPSSSSNTPPPKKVWPPLDVPCRRPSWSLAWFPLSEIPSRSGSLQANDRRLQESSEVFGEIAGRGRKSRDEAKRGLSSETFRRRRRRSDTGPSPAAAPMVHRSARPSKAS